MIEPGRYTLFIGPDSATAAQEAMFTVGSRTSRVVARRSNRINKKALSDVKKTKPAPGERPVAGAQNAF